MSFYSDRRYGRSGGGVVTMALVAGGIVTLVAISAVVGLLMAIPVYFLWNWLMPTVFGLTTITYWQAWGLYFLSAILLKSTPSSSRRS